LLITDKIDQEESHNDELENELEKEYENESETIETFELRRSKRKSVKRVILALEGEEDNE
jgi:hypothetical protein